MTTAARPTWHPAVGGLQLRDTNAAPVHLVSARDLATQTKLKLRQPGQNAPEDLNSLDEIRMKERLEEKEREHFEKARRGEKRKEISAGIEEDESSKRQRTKIEPNIDADDSEDDDEASESDSDSSDDDDDDDEAELLRELEKIRRERAEEKERQERAKMEEDEKQREEEALTGNPLLESQASKDFSVKRRWDDDVVFKNQARGVEDNPKKRFINDVLRSDFHRKFMSKYVK
ncbi:Pre-mRNA-splicing factor Cwf15/Cwc15 [Fimicolochytrium jonesii]|uniref:Pre-mRNA-splicing factor Cwf15/Cwc15 n=1 Tax=Fimicolochytrium jonesii TaxID=1396493 RepID=UPI0022FEB5AA|nr:Pre-mRNA-splicing factor Cwf15/Cwc15 [Fimicolochytrium jonesii]KAI8824361.1 Pre-mRNA-splicing factor Cwf15/Cwc15 [Fimicolochytrium jonesii]